jgi:hypothetical protein
LHVRAPPPGSTRAPTTSKCCRGPVQGRNDRSGNYFFTATTRPGRARSDGTFTILRLDRHSTVRKINPKASRYGLSEWQPTAPAHPAQHPTHHSASATKLSANRPATKCHPTRIYTFISLNGFQPRRYLLQRFRGTKISYTKQTLSDFFWGPLSSWKISGSDGTSQVLADDGSPVRFTI